MLQDAPTLTALLQARAQAQPDLRVYTFLADGERAAGTLTAADLDRRARALAAALQETVRPGDRALLLLPPGLDFIAAFFGCLYAGVVAVPAYPPRTHRVDARLWEIFRDCQPQVVLTTAAILGRLRAVQDSTPELRAARWVAADLVPEDLADRWREPPLEAGSLAFLQYTSGSTSTPKGVKVSHGNLLHNQRMIQRAFRQSEDSVVVSWLPLYHDMGLIGGVLQPLFSGSRCVLMSPWAFLQSPARWLEAISRYRATTSGGPDFAYELCVRKVRPERRAELDLSAWEVAFNGAEPVRAATLDRFAEAFAPCGFRRAAFHPCYGLAEATLLVTGGGNPAPLTLEVESDALAADRVQTGGSTGRSLVGSGRVPAGLGEEVVIVEPATGVPCESGRVGEIWVSGPHVAGGYWNRPEESAQVFGAFLPGGEGPFLRTGDLGFLHEGELFITGRIKDLIILRGRNLYPQDVERTAERAHPALRPGSGAAFSVEVEGEERLVVVHELEPRARVDVDRVAATIRQAVAEEHEARVHEVALIAAGSLPKTSSGKVQRRACRAAWLAGSLEVVGRSAVPGPAPDEISATGGSLEDRLGREVSRLAGGSAVDPETPLAALGLDSLAAVELASWIETETGALLSATDLLRCAGLRTLTAEIAEAVARGEGTAGGADSAPVPHGPETGEHPLSPGQQALWLVDRLAPAAAAYNLAVAARVEAGLDTGALRRAFSALARRHPALRTTFGERGGEPVQRVHAELEPEFEESDAGGWSAEQLAAELDREAWRPFALETGPPWRVRVFHGAAGGSLLLFVIHHLVADFGSLAILVRELAEIYRQETGGVPAVLESQPLRYADWARWQERRLAGPRGDRLWAYWRQRLGGGLPVLDLPADRPRPPVRSWRGGSRAWRLAPATIATARRAGGEGATLFVTLLAGFQALLHRYTGQDDLLVGSPVTGRGAATAGVVGYFVHPVALRADLSDRPGFAALAARGRTTALEALEHGDFPLLRLAERLRPDRAAAGSPLFQVMLAVQSAGPDAPPGLAGFGLGEDGARVRIGDLALESVALRERRALFDLTLFAAETEEGGADLALGFDADLFDAVTAERLLGHLETLLLAGAADPARPVATLPILTERERAQLLEEWNDTGRVRPGAPFLHEAFAAQVERTPEATALIWGEESVPYAELLRRARRIAVRLRRLGAGPEVRLGVLMGRRPELVATLLGVLEAGAAYVPLDPAYPEERLRFMLEDAEAAAVLTWGEEQSALARRLAGPQLPVVRLDADGEDEETGPAVLPSALPGNLAYLIYTSGSTGRPKAVAIEHRSAAAFLEWAGAFFPAADLARVLAATSIAFDISIFEIFAPLSRGGAVVLAENALALPGLPAAGSLTLVNTVPSAMAELLRLGGLPSSVRVVNLPGEPLAAELVDTVYRLCPAVRAVYNLYGPSEDTTYSTVAKVDRGARSITVGRPTAGSRVYVVDPEMQLRPPGLPGEVMIGGAGLARGYLGRPALTAERFLPDPFASGERLYRTGDLGRFRPDGQLEILGRLDHQVKIRGFRIELGEVEAALRRHDGLREAVVVARPDGGGILSLAAFYVPGEVPPEPTDLRSFLRRSLPEHMVPTALVALDALPLTPNGKVDRKALRERTLAVSGEPASGPESPTEEVLAGIWADVLGVERVGARDHFFDLGGHSLLASRVAARIREGLGVELPLSTVFERPVLTDLARAVEERRRPADLPPLVPVPRDPTGAPLSFAQQRLWFLDRLAPGSAVYNMPAAVRLAGRLDRPALAATLDEVARRHETLRTTFREVAGEARQRVVPALDLSPAVVDLADLPAAAREEEAHRLAAEEARRPFDLEAGPLVRVRLLALRAEEHVALLTLHHIVADGESLGVFLGELAALYRAFAAGEPYPLAGLPVQYADYAAWQRNWLRDGALEARLAPWRRRLAGAPTVLELPADRSRPPVQRFRGAHEALELDADLLRGLRALAREAEATLFMALGSGLAALLSRYTGEDDLLIGTAAANRGRVEVEGLIGFFVNTLALRVDLGGSPDGRALLRRFRETALAAYAGQDLPFEALVEALEPRRDLSRAPLVQVFLAMQPPLPAVTLPGLALHPAEVPTGTAKFDLSALITETDPSLTVSLEYDRDLFDPATIRRFLAHFRSLLAGLSEPGRPVAEIPILSVGERNQLLNEWGTASSALGDGATLPERFAAWVEREPGAVAAVYEDRSWTYAELDRRAERLAATLRTLGAGPERVVGLCLDAPADLPAAVLGVWKAGAAYLPLDPAYPAERLAFMVEDSEVRVVLTSGPPPERLAAAAAGLTVLRLDALSREENPLPNPLPRCRVGEGATAHHLAYVIYTSGSTGRPKGVMLSHRGLANIARFQAAAYGLGPGGRVLQFSSASFDASVYEIAAAFGAGAALVLADRGSRLPGPELTGLLRRQEVTFALLPPSALAVLDGDPLPDLALLNVGGEACTPDLVSRWAPGRRFFNLYGPTEVTIVATAAELDAADPVPVLGRPLPGTRAIVVDRAGRGLEPAPTGVAGELFLGGEGLARGYLGRPDLTAERFLPDPWAVEPGARIYRSGDLARWRSDGRLEFLGRADHQIKVRGFRIEPGEIEAALRSLPEVTDAAVVAREDRPGDRRLVAFVVPRGLPEMPKPDDLRAALRRRLPEHMVPAVFSRLETLPLTPSGKVDRRALAVLELPGEERDGTFQPPRTPVEELVAQLWADVLGRERVGVTDGFFDLGGHSLLATRLLSRVRDAFGVELPLRALFEEPTVEGLAARLERERRGEAEPPLTRRPRTPGDGSVPLSFAQQRLWFLHQLAPESPFYNMAGAFLFAGRLDEAALAASLREIARRHETLRTRFPAEGGSPRQEILPEPEVAVPVADLSALPAAAREEEARRLTLAEARRPFDLERGPLLRLALLRLEPERHRLLATLHHIVSDGWSMGVLFRELPLLYQAFAIGRPSPLPEPPVQYADFALWQRERLAGPVRERELAYWRDRLDGVPSLELPTDRPRPVRQSFRGATLGRELPNPVMGSLRALARQWGATPFMVLLAGFQALLQRYTGQDEIVVGLPIANRDRTEIEGLIGFFVNTLVLRTPVAADASFPDLVTRVRELALGAYAHQALPFETLVEELQPERDLSKQPLFQVMFQLLENPLAPVELPGVRLEPLEVDAGTAHFDLGLDLFETAAGTRALARYSTDLFDAATIRRLLEHYAVLLGGITASPERPISSLPLLTGPEIHQLRWEWNDTEEPEAGLPVHRAFAAVAAARPDAVAVSAGGQELTYGELERLANRLAHRLIALGARPSMPVALYVERTPLLAVSLLAIWKAGAAFLPLDTSLPRPRLAVILDDAFQDVEGALVLTESALAGQLPESRARLLVLDEEGPELPESLESPAVEPGDLAYLIYTSGTSGVPKAVRVGHASLANVLAVSRRDFGWDAADRMPCLASASFDIFLFELLNPLLAGGTAVLFSLRPVPDVVRLVDALPGLTRLHAVPALMREIVDEIRERGDGERFPGLRTVFTGGDAVPADLLADLLAVFPHAEVRVLYGPTEGTIIGSSDRVPRGAEVRSRLGRPLGNVTLRLRDRAGNLVPIGVPGEIILGGAAVALGYLHREELTRERFVNLEGERCYRTGDLARYLPDGGLEFLGRADQQVKIRGFRIEPAEIEAALLRHAAVHEAAVLAREDTPGERRLVAYVVCRPDDDPLWASHMAGDLESEQVEQWRTVYDTGLFGHAAAELADPTFNVSGWNSSYTGEPIPESEMREWVDGTVARILEHLPARSPLGPRVLEIGCGTGLLLFRLASHCRRYVGTDFSATELAYVRGVLESLPEALGGVELRRALADDFSDLEPGSFDAVVLNSVSQYFPSADYLVRVLAGAVRAVAPGGFVFVGDVRNLALLRALHASVELERAPAGLSRERLASRVEVRMAEEEELLLAPALFPALRAHLPGVSGVEVQLRRGTGHNELTRFRYDAVLHVASRDAAAGRDPVRWDWRQEGLSLAALRDRLRQDGAPADVLLRRVPNARVAAALEALALLEDPEGPETASGLRQAVAAAVQAAPALDPESFWALEREVPYAVAVTWPESGGPGFFDVLFRRLPADAPASAAALRTLPPGTLAAAGHGPWSRYANNPLRQRIAQGIVPGLRAFLAERLPDYMVPSAIVLLERLPQTAHGKVDRKALPAPENLRPELDAAYEAPRDAVEQALAEIWSRLLEVDRVGIHDNFFDLGGHSLMATRVVAAVRRSLGVEVPLRTLFEAPTVAGLAVAVARAGNAGDAGEDGPAADPEAIPRQPRHPGVNRFPVTFSQLREWLLVQFEPGTTAYNMAGAVRLTGRLDAARLERALDALVERHESLRTTFAAVPGEPEPVQVVAPSLRVPLPRVDLSALPGDRAEATARRIVQDDAATPFDLARGPLLRAALLRLGAAEHVLLLNMHHIVSDGWSIRGVLFPELAELYSSLASGRAPVLRELPIQVPDFAVWQRGRLQGETLAGHLDYWKERLAGAPPLLDMPADRPRPAVRSGRGSRMEITLGAVATAALRDLARRERASLFMALLAVFKTVLHRYSGQDDLPVGTYISNRRQAELEGLIGFFINTLVLRTDLSGGTSFRELLGRVREVTLGAYAHQDLPFEKVLDALQLERDVSRTPLIQALLTLQNFPSTRLEIPELTLELIPLSLGVADFDLTLMLTETPGGLAGYIDYSTDLYEAATIRTLLAVFARVAEAATVDPDRPVDTLPLMSEAERREVIGQGVTVPVEPLRLGLEERVAAQARARPDAPAVEHGGSALPYGELEERAGLLARRLRQLGVRPEVVVAIALERSPAAIVAMLGVLQAGGAYVPLDPAYPAERLAFMLVDSGARVLIRGGADTADLGGPDLPRVTLTPDGRLSGGEETMEEGAVAPSPAERGRVGEGVFPPESPAYVIYTSGSTGRPKGVVVPRCALAHYADVAAEGYGIGPGDRVLQFASLSFDTSAEEIYPCLTHGATLVLRSEAMATSIAGFLAEVDRLGITVLDLPTAYWHELVAALEPGGMPRSVRLVILGGEKALADRMAAWVRLTAPGPRLVNTYGPTEATIVATRWDLPPAFGAGEVPIGRPIPGAEAWVLDPRLEPLPAGVPGELYVGGAGLARGYLGRPDLTAERFLPHPFARRSGERLYRTGDRVRRLAGSADGDLQFLGRADQQIKLRGFRIEPGEVEAALRRHPDVHDAVVALHQDRHGTRRLAAWVVPANGAVPAPAGLRAFLKERLPDHLVPALFTPLPALPLTPGGKVDRRRLPAPDEERPDLGAGYVAPRSDLERTLAALWREVLPVDRVGVHDNFFELGGDSLLLLQAHRRMAEVLGAEAAGLADLSVIDLFQYPTVAALAQHLAGRGARDGRHGNTAPEREAIPDRVRDRTDQQRAALARQKQRMGPQTGPPRRPSRS